jgi:multiubiquitin
MEQQNSSNERSGESLEMRVERLVEEVEILLEEIDVEQHARAGHKPAKAKRYRIRVDDRYFVVHQHSMTGMEILQLADKVPPAAFILTEKTRGGGLRTVNLNDIVEFCKHGLERFTTLPRQVQEG